MIPGAKKLEGSLLTHKHSLIFHGYRLSSSQALLRLMDILIDVDIFTVMFMNILLTMSILIEDRKFLICLLISSS